MLAEAQKKKSETTLDDIKKSFGQSYREMLAEVNDVLVDPAAQFPALAGHKPELAGFVWFQGWNDMINADYTAEYASNLAHFIRDVRRDLKAPALPVIVAQMGVEGTSPSANIQRFKTAQAAGVELPEFKGNVVLVKTDVFWDNEADAVFKQGWREHREEWDKVGSDYPYHYLGSAKTLCAIGKACAEALLDLRGKQEASR
jgi:alpha-galactosidase